MRIDDGLGADLEFALGLRQLLGHALLAGLDCGQRILRRQHVEIGLGHAQHKIVAGQRKLRLGLLHCELGLIELIPKLRPIQRQRRGQRRSPCVERTRKVRVAVVEVGFTDAQTGRNIRQQRAACLRRALLRGLARKARRGKYRIERHRVAIDRQQVVLLLRGDATRDDS